MPEDPDRALPAKRAKNDAPAPTLITGVQRLLKDLGYEPGGVDGIPGPKTRAAIQAYQRANGLEINGVIDSALAAHLEQKVSAASLAHQVKAHDEREPRDRRLKTGPIADYPSLKSEFDRFIVRIEALGAKPSLIREMRSLRPEMDIPWRRIVVRDDFYGFADLPQSWSSTMPKIHRTWNRGIWLTAGDGGGPSLGDRIASLFRGSANARTKEEARGTGINRKTEFANAFRVRIGFFSPGDRGRLIVTATQTGAAPSGYRLTYVAAPPARFEISTFMRGKVTSRKSGTSHADLRDRFLHELQWTRFADGRMKVTLDGVLLLQAADKDVSGTFNEFGLASRNGTFSIARVRIDDIAPPLGRRRASD